MKRFNFKLEKLLSYRGHLEKEEQNKFAVVLGKYVAIEKVIDSSLAERNRMLSASRDLMDRGDLSLFYYREKARKGLTTRMKDYSKKLEAQAIPLNEAREALILARQKKKAIELLKNKAKVRHDKELEKEEQNELDEFGNNSFYRKMKLSDQVDDQMDQVKAIQGTYNQRNGQIGDQHLMTGGRYGRT